MDADEIAAGFACLARIQRGRIALCRRYVRDTLIVQGASLALALVLMVGALVIAADRQGMNRAAMLACAALNGATVVLCVHAAWTRVRMAMREAREARALLRQVEADWANLQASRRMLADLAMTLPAGEPLDTNLSR